MAQEIRETELRNGLRILTCESRSVPAVSFWAWYRVGARNEPGGLTGASHFLEHMLFKSGKADQSRPSPRSDIARKVARVGGMCNAFTSRDFTCYFETLPSAHLDLALRIERERLETAITDSGFDSERTVVLSEKEGARNHPHTLLSEALEASAFRKHPYGRPVIGSTDDLLHMKPAHLRSYFRRHYAPNNTVIVAAGDFDADKLLRKIETNWGDLRRHPADKWAPPVEPPQRAERRVFVEKPGGAAYVEILCKGPASGHPDIYPLMVADAILSGGKSYLGSNATGQRTSRLYNALVATGIASSIHSSIHPAVDPFGFTLGATAIDPARRDHLERVLLEQVERLADEIVPERELRKAITQLMASYAYSIESVTNLALALGFMEMTESHRLLNEYPGRIQSVTAADVQRVARKYFTPRGRTVGWFVPTAPSYVPEKPVDAGPAVFAFTGFRPMARVVTENGATVLAAENPISPSVVIHGSFPGGSAYNTAETAGLAGFTASCSMRGTRRKSHQQIFQAVDSLGAWLHVSAGLHDVDFTVKCLAEHWPDLFDLLLEILRQPAFPPDQVELVRSLIFNFLRQVDDSPQHLAGRELHHLIYPPGHPYHSYPMGYPETISAIGRRDLQAFHDAYYAPEKAIICIVGSIAAQQAADQLARAVARWRKQRIAPIELDASAPNSPRRQPHVKRIAMKEKSQSEIVLGFPGPSRTDATYMPMEVLTQIIGGLGLMGRLGHTIREKQGMAYYAYASFSATPGQFPWSVHAGVNPKNVDRAIASILNELKRVREASVSEHELRDTRGFLIGSLPLRLETNDGRAAALHHIEYYGLGADYVDRYPRLVESISARQIRAAARKWIDTKGYSLVVAGPEENEE